MENTKNFKNKEGGRIAGGVILVAIGAVLLLRNIGFTFPSWLFSWPMILIVVGIYSGFKHNFRNNSWLIVIGVGVFFLVNEFIPNLGLKPLFWPLIIIGLGVLFILKPRNKEWLNFNKDMAYDQPENTPNTTFKQEATAASIDSNDYLMVRSVFSGVNKRIVSKNFQGGRISCVFGGAEIDCSQAEINGQVLLKLEAVFGGIKLIVPPHWAVQNEIDGVFHGVDDKRRFNPDATINSGKVLILKGSAVFGGIEIRSY